MKLQINALEKLILLCNTEMVENVHFQKYKTIPG